jgi:protein-tyrosine phosphatase
MFLDATCDRLRASGVAAARRRRTADMVFSRLRRALDSRRGYPSGPRIDRVAPWLLIGPALHRRDYRELATLEVTHVVDLRAEASDDTEAARLRAAGIVWHHAPIADRMAPSFDAFGALLEWLNEARDVAGNEMVLYVHCEGGVGRTPTVATALLMATGFSLPDAMRLVRAARPESAPTEEQQRWLESLRFDQAESA